MIIFHRHWKIPFSWWFGTIQKPVVDLSLFFLKERQWPQPVWSQTAAPSPKARSTSSRCRMHIRDCCWKLDNVFRVHEGKPWKSWKCSFISCFMSSVSTVNSNMYYRCTYGPWVLHDMVDFCWSMKAWITHQMYWTYVCDLTSNDNYGGNVW